METPIDSLQHLVAQNHIKYGTVRESPIHLGEWELLIDSVHFLLWLALEFYCFLFFGGGGGLSMHFENDLMWISVKMNELGSKLDLFFYKTMFNIYWTYWFQYSNLGIVYDSLFRSFYFKGGTG